MQDKYCLPIIAKEAQAVLSKIERYSNEYAYFEVWLDYLTVPDMRFIRGLTGRLPGKLIFVFRRKELEPTRLSHERRLEIIEALDHMPVYIDLDLKDQFAELETLKAEQLHLEIITSYHNYQETPNDDELRDIIMTMKTYNPAIVKIATYCRNETDALRLLTLQLALKELGQRHVILGMGEQGVITRIFGTMWSNEFIFAPQHTEDASAPGQLTRRQLDAIFHVLLPSKTVE